MKWLFVSSTCLIISLMYFGHFLQTGPSFAHHSKSVFSNTPFGRYFCSHESFCFCLMNIPVVVHEIFSGHLAHKAWLRFICLHIFNDIDSKVNGKCF